MSASAPTTDYVSGRYSRQRLDADSISKPSISYEPLADGVEGTLRSLDAMADAVQGRVGPDYSGYKDSYNKQAALFITRYAGNTDAQEIAALFVFVRDRIGYVDHPWNMQVVMDARRCLEIGYADCVSKSTLLVTLLASLGHISRFVAQAPNGEDFDHVFCEVGLDGRYVALDPTADGKGGRPLGDVGWFRVLPDYAAETTKSIFD